MADGVAEGSPPPPEAAQRVVDAALTFVARTRSPLCVLPLEDLLGQEDQPNLPGTTDQHPNWRRRLSAPVEAALQQEDPTRRVTAAAAERPRT